MTRSSSAALAPIVENMPQISPLYALNTIKARAQLPPGVFDIAVLFDGSRTVTEVARAARISETKCARVVKKLTTLGLLGRADVGRRGVTKHERLVNQVANDGFTALDHSFFNKEVEPIDECDEELSSLGDRFRASLAEFFVRFRSEKAIG